MPEPSTCIYGIGIQYTDGAQTLEVRMKVAACSHTAPQRDVMPKNPQILC